MDAMQYGRYRIVSELGRGAMGVVYQAHDPQIDRMVALKVLRQDRVVDQEFVRRFTAEARAIGRLSHPNIVTVFDVGEDHGTIYIAMEFLQGRSLDLILREETLSLEKSVDLAMQVADALYYAHGQGVIHRDIKPGNILLTPQGHVKVTDFGIARIEGTAGHQVTQMGEILGTPNYMPPEQVAGQPVDGRSDIYAIGVVLYELTTGKRPFSADNLAMLFTAIGNQTPVAPSKLNPAVPEKLSDVIMRCLSKSPAQRFQNGNSLSQALKTCLAARPDPGLAGGSVVAKRRKRIYALIGLAVFIFVGALAFYLVLDMKKRPRPVATAVQQKPVVSKTADTSGSKKPSQNIVPKEKPVKPEVGGKPLETVLREAVIPEKPAGKGATAEKAGQFHANLTPAALTGRLYIDVEPSGARIRILNIKPRYDRGMALKPGRYHIEVSAPEHQRQARWVEVAAGKDNRYPFVLKKTIPPNTRAAGTASSQPKKEQRQTLATLDVQSAPAGASLYVDGKYRGTTPYKVKLPYGRYEIRLQHENYLGWEAQINIDKAEEIPLNIRLIRKE